MGRIGASKSLPGTPACPATNAACMGGDGSIEGDRGGPTESRYPGYPGVSCGEGKRRGAEKHGGNGGRMRGAA